MTVKKTITEKLLEIFKQVQNVSKDSRNTFQNYDYVSANKLMETFHPLFADAGLILRPSVTNVVHSSYKNAKGEEVLTCALTMRYEIIDTISGETSDYFIPSFGIDKGDKAIFKAMTGALKYFFLQTFMLSTEDDPEADGEKPIARQAVTQRNVRSLDKSYAQQPEPNVEQIVPKENPWAHQIEADNNAKKGQFLFNLDEKVLRDGITKAPEKFTKNDLKMIASAFKYRDGKELAMQAYLALQKIIGPTGQKKTTIEQDELPTWLQEGQV